MSRSFPASLLVIACKLCNTPCCILVAPCSVFVTRIAAAPARSLDPASFCAHPPLVLTRHATSFPACYSALSQRPPGLATRLLLPRHHQRPAPPLLPLPFRVCWSRINGSSFLQFRHLVFASVLPAQYYSVRRTIIYGALSVLSCPHSRLLFRAHFLFVFFLVTIHPHPAQRQPTPSVLIRTRSRAGRFGKQAKAERGGQSRLHSPQSRLSCATSRRWIEENSGPSNTPAPVLLAAFCAPPG